MSQILQADDSIVKSPLISVVIPAFNAAAYIAATIDSVLAQTYRDFEIIVVNDGSPDTSAMEDALRPYFERIRYYFRQENHGPSKARNLGIREARGKYLALLDSDDLWLPQHLERQIKLFSDDPTLGLAYANGVQFRGNIEIGTAFANVPQIGTVTFESLLAERCTINTSSVVVLRDAVIHAGSFDETMNRCEDFDLWLRLAAAGVGMSYDRELQVRHRLSNGLSANRELMKRGRADVYRKIAATQQLTAAQQQIVNSKLRELETEINVEVARESLLNGDFRRALSAIENVNSLVQQPKLRMAEIGLRYFPRPLRWLYRNYLHFLDAYKGGRGAFNTARSGNENLSPSARAEQTAR